MKNENLEIVKTEEKLLTDSPRSYTNNRNSDLKLDNTRIHEKESQFKCGTCSYVQM